MCARILVVEDEALIRTGLVSIINKDQPTWEVIEAADGCEAIRKVNACHPDLILMDHLMRRLNGAEAARMIRERFPEIKVIMVSGALNEDVLLKTMGAGVKGYVTKDDTGTELMQAIHTVLNGKVHLKGTTLDMAQRATEKEKRRLLSPYGPFSSREMSVLELVVQGLTSRQIAEKLHISRRTVEHHRASLLARSGCRSQAELIRFALKEKIVKD